jgi:hypothetical protein
MHAVFSAYIKTPLLIMLGGFSSGYYWSSTENDTSFKWYRSLHHYNGSVTRNSDWPSYGFSVRCLRD